MKCGRCYGRENKVQSTKYSRKHQVQVEISIMVGNINYSWKHQLQLCLSVVLAGVIGTLKIG